MDNLLTMRLVKVNLKFTCPHHASCVFKRVGNVEVHASMYEDVFFQFHVGQTGVHPINIQLRNFARMFYPETL